MAKTITSYGCDICGRVFSRPEDAEGCERSHAVIKEVRSGYNLAAEVGKYPDFLDVTFKNGQEIRYYRKQA